jgi:glycine cleavage system regulatory protein
VGAVLESRRAAMFHAGLADTAVGEFGDSKRWHRNRLRTGSRFPVGRYRPGHGGPEGELDDAPDLMVLDDMDDEPRRPSERKQIPTLTRKLLPAGDGGVHRAGSGDGLPQFGDTRRLSDGVAGPPSHTRSSATRGSAVRPGPARPGSRPTAPFAPDGAVSAILRSVATYEVSVGSQDRQGVARAVMEGLHDHRANVRAAVLTVIQGHGSMTAIIEVDDAGTEHLVEQAIRDRAEQDGIVLSRVGVIDVSTGKRPDAGETTRLEITLYVEVDQPGILRRFTGLLYDHGANMVELFARAYVDGDVRRAIIIAHVTVPRTVGGPGEEGGAARATLEEAIERWRAGVVAVAKATVVAVTPPRWSPGL